MCITQVLRYLGHPIVIELGDLLLLLRNRLARLGDIGICIGNLAFQTVPGALQLQNAWTSDQSSFDERRNIFRLIAD